MIRIACAIFALVASRASAADLSGLWLLKAQGVPVMAFLINRTPRGAVAQWIRPRHFSMTSDQVSDLSATTESLRATSVTLLADGVEMRFPDHESASPTILRLREVDADRASLALQGDGFEPLDLERGTSLALGPFPTKGVLTVTRARWTNPEMTAIYDADQAARSGKGRIDWTVVGPQDDARRQRTQALLDKGQLSSGDDFLHAAFVFQHGHAPDDYLKAHLLAQVAIARGRPDATWIASATLDRFLQSIGRPQVLGTQFVGSRGGRFTRGAYEPGLLSDPLRQALRVPTLAEQSRQLEEMNGVR